MIQRIQSVYLLLVFITSAVLPYIFNLWVSPSGQLVYFMSNIAYIILFGLSATFALLSLLSYKNRQQQFVLNRLAMIFNLILLGLFVYCSLNLSGETLVSKKGIGMFLPVLSILLLVFANRAIKKDEDLVKSVDRLR